jgi:hypothetical protein
MTHNAKIRTRVGQHSRTDLPRERSGIFPKHVLCAELDMGVSKDRAHSVETGKRRTHRDIHARFGIDMPNKGLDLGGGLGLSAVHFPVADNELGTHGYS